MIWSKRYIFFFGNLIHLILAWDYRDVDSWKKEYPDCDGNSQSPIALDDELHNVDDNKKVQFENYDVEPDRMFIANDGHTVELTGYWEEGEIPTVIYDDKEYKFVYMNFRWGPSNFDGSEHEFEYQRTPLEVQLVHWNDDFGRFKLDKGKGILIVAVLLEIDNNAPVNLTSILEYFYKIKISSPRRQEVWPVSLSAVTVQPFPEYFLTYTGSLTSPPCTEGVSWVIFSETSKISEKQMDLIRVIRLRYREDHNNRPIQSIDQQELTLVPS